MRNKLVLLLFGIVSIFSLAQKHTSTQMKNKEKLAVYQVFTRLFGNTNTNNKPWGTMQENGVGKFSDFSDKALIEIKNLGITHIWYTGVPHHALVNDYTKIGISNDDPEVVKGRAGSPYAVKDYYQVNPDLATHPENRLQEFEDLIKRTHKNGLKVIIDIVPNHVARKYEGKNNPKDIMDFGANDDKTVEYKRDNNFYYVPNTPFELPDFPNEKPLNGEITPLIDGKFDEFPAKWTGNGSRNAKPHVDDWYETVKINYGIKPDGTKDFPLLPEGYDKKDYRIHYQYWLNKDIPDSWKKFKDIALFWLSKGVDGFRFDMSEMVPYEFWSYMNSSIKMKNPSSIVIAEVYNFAEYRNYIHLGKMDYLYDKIGTYDALKEIVQGKSTCEKLVHVQNSHQDIEHHMLHFLDNHDEQRLANEAFAKTAERGKPLMVVSTLFTTAPTMIYFGQEVGEKAEENVGFGKATRTSIFDYVGVPAHQRWMNDGKFDGGKLSKQEKDLREFYKNLLNFSIKNEAISGNAQELYSLNLNQNPELKNVFSFARWKNNSKVVVISNLSDTKIDKTFFIIPNELIAKWNLQEGSYTFYDVLDSNKIYTLKVKNGIGKIKTKLKISQSLVLKN
jgi:glycosidase